MRLTAAMVIACVSSVVYADEPTPPPPASQPPNEAGSPAVPPAPSPPDQIPPDAGAEPPPSPAELAARLDELEARQRKSEAAQRRTNGRLDHLGDLDWLASFLTVFVDIGVFAVGGDGSGIRSDLDHVYYPKYAGQTPGQWVFIGDPRSTAINSLGEPADTSDSRELTRNTVHSGGHPSLLVNSLGLAIGKDVTKTVEVSALAELLPRPSGNLLDIELATVNYRPVVLEGAQLLIQAGKIDSVLGIEYRAQDAFSRLEITPSLASRYTTGRPLGIEVRYNTPRINASAALTNGDLFDHRFDQQPLLHPTWLPTAAGHVQIKVPVALGLAVGMSGAIGPQDAQPSTSIAQWHLGFDVQLRDLGRWDVQAEYVQGLQQGQTMATPCDIAPCLTYKAAYVLVDRRVAPWIIPYGRIDWRDAVHTHGAEFVYESHVLRATVGAHFELTSRVIAKLEYTWNHELDGVPQFADDVITSSLVVRTD